MRGQGLFNARYIYEETGLPGQALPFDWDTFTADPAQVRIGAFNATRGEPDAVCAQADCSCASAYS